MSQLAQAVERAVRELREKFKVREQSAKTHKRKDRIMDQQDAGLGIEPETATAPDVQATAPETSEAAAGLAAGETTMAKKRGRKPKTEKAIRKNGVRKQRTPRVASESAADAGAPVEVFDTLDSAESLAERAGIRLQFGKRKVDVSVSHVENHKERIATRDALLAWLKGLL